MNTFRTLSANTRFLYLPFVSSFLIGINLPTLIEKEKYYEIPILCVMPVLYTGYKIGEIGNDSKKKMEEYFKTMEENTKEMEEYLKKNSKSSW
jgi:hypothetical protein